MGTDIGYALDVHPASQSVYVGGNFAGLVDFDPGDTIDVHVADGPSDAFVVRYDLSGTYYWSKAIGGFMFDVVGAIGVRSDGTLYVGGNFMSTEEFPVDFDPGPGVDEIWSTGFYQLFLSKYDSNGNYLWTRTTFTTSDGLEGAALSDLCIADGGILGVMGRYSGSVDFNTCDNEDVHTAGDDPDAFILRFNDY